MTAHGIVVMSHHQLSHIYIIFTYDSRIFFGIINLCMFCISLVVAILNTDNPSASMSIVKISKDTVT